MPRQPATSIRRPPTSSVPVNTASGSGLSSFVRGSGARYIHARGRCLRAASAARGLEVPRGRPAVRLGAPGEPRRLADAGAGSDCLTAYGGPASASHTVHHSAPVGASPGRACEVWRIQAPRGRAGSTARR